LTWRSRRSCLKLRFPSSRYLRRLSHRVFRGSSAGAITIFVVWQGSDGSQHPCILCIFLSINYTASRSSKTAGWDRARTVVAGPCAREATARRDGRRRRSCRLPLLCSLPRAPPPLLELVIAAADPGLGASPHKAGLDVACMVAAWRRSRAWVGGGGAGVAGEQAWRGPRGDGCGWDGTAAEQGKEEKGGQRASTVAASAAACVAATGSGTAAVGTGAAPAGEVEPARTHCRHRLCPLAVADREPSVVLAYSFRVPSIARFPLHRY